MSDIGHIVSQRGCHKILAVQAHSTSTRTIEIAIECPLWVESGFLVYVASRPPNYSQERIQRERKQRAKAEEKADRNAEKVARRRVARAEGMPPPNDADTKPS